MLVIFIGLSIIQFLATIVLFGLHRFARAEAVDAQRRVEELTKRIKEMENRAASEILEDWKQRPTLALALAERPE